MGVLQGEVRGAFDLLGILLSIRRNSFFGCFNSNFSLLKHQLCKVTMGLFYNSSQNNSSFPWSGALSRVGVQKSSTNSAPGKSRVLSSEN